MMTPSRHPVVYGGFAAALVALAASYGLIKTEDRELWVTILVGAPVAIAYVVQKFTMALSVIKKAGITPEEIHEAADDPNIPPVK